MTIRAPFWAAGKLRAVIVTGIVASLIYAAIALMTDASRLISALHQLGIIGCTSVLGLSLLNYLSRFYRWSGFLLKLGRSVPLHRRLLCYLGGFAFTLSPAKAGEAVRSLYLRDYDVKYSESIAMLFVERLLDLFAIVLLAGLIVLDHPSYRGLFLACLALVIILIACVCRSSLAPWVDRLGQAFGGRVALGTSAFANLLRSSRMLLEPRYLISGEAIGLMAWGAEGLGFGIICCALNIGGSVLYFCGIYATAVLGGTVAFFLPAGIGGTELVMTTLLVEQGAPLSVAIVATLLCRLATLWFAVLLGIGAASAITFSGEKTPVRAAR